MSQINATTAAAHNADNAQGLAHLATLMEIAHRIDEAGLAVAEVSYLMRRPNMELQGDAPAIVLARTLRQEYGTIFGGADVAWDLGRIFHTLTWLRTRNAA